jgi:hypothetical protein
MYGEEERFEENGEWARNCASGRGCTAALGHQGGWDSVLKFRRRLSGINRMRSLHGVSLHRCFLAEKNDEYR